MLRSAHKIQGLYYTWHSKRQKLIAHLKFLYKCMTKFQSQFRRRKATQLTKIIRFIKHVKMATVCQSAIRMYLAKCLRRRNFKRLHYIKHHLIAFSRSVFSEAELSHHGGTAVKSKLLPDEHTQTSTSVGMTRAEQWKPAQTLTALDQFLCNMIAVGRYETAFKIAADISSHSGRTLKSESISVATECVVSDG